MFPALIGLGGVLLGLIGTWVLTIISKNKELEQKEVEYQRDYKDKYLIVPIISFIDDTLSIMDNFYWGKFRGLGFDTNEGYEKLSNRDGMIKARIFSYKDEELNNAFDEFIKNYGKFIKYILNNELPEANDILKESHLIAGIIFNRIKPTLKK